jgi:hypothetical protein
MVNPILLLLLPTTAACNNRHNNKNRNWVFTTIVFQQQQSPFIKYHLPNRQQPLNIKTTKAEKKATPAASKQKGKREKRRGEKIMGAWNAAP